MASALPPLSQLGGGHTAMFDALWSKLDTNSNGRIDATTAAAFLKKSRLRETVLHKIWELSDPTGRGFLDKQGFYLAMRLVASCQSGKEPSLSSLSSSDPAPNLGSLDGVETITKNKWTISGEERARYNKKFQSLQPVGGLVSGEKAKPIMLLSKLPFELLGKIWGLADADHDGSVNADEFAIVMHLVTLCQAGEPLPSSLPPSLLTKSTTALAGSTGSPLTPSPSPATPLTPSQAAPLTRTLSPHPSPISDSPLPARKMSGGSSDWVVSEEVKAKYDVYFDGIDKDRDGVVTGEEARGLFMASSLPQPVLAHIWMLSDITRTGKLNREQFALAMFLIAERVRGKEPPKELTPAMIPPSLRGKLQSLTGPSAASAASASSAPLLPTSPSPAFLPTPIIAPGTSSVALPTPLTSTLTPTPPVGGGAPPPATAGGGGFADFAADFSAIRELDSVAKEIDDIKKEKTTLAEEIQMKKELIHQREEEIHGLQEDAGVYSKQRTELEREKGEAQGKLNLMEAEKARVEKEVAELKQKCKDEEEEIERLKSQLSQQEVSKRAGEQEVASLREQLEGLQQEEVEYRRRVEGTAGELERVQKTNQSIQREISQVRHKVDSLREEHQSLSHSLALFPHSASPSSSTPPSSVVNINDVGQLSAELTAPQLGEPDAISARATAGSSSPVSSISGFSTNSHLDDPPAEDTPTSGPPSSGRERSSDPFAAFAAPSADPFASSRPGASLLLGKRSPLSAFDPFGSSSLDPFKSNGGVGEDLFKSDPFSTGHSSAAPTTPSASTDPFSGQDPFSSDPFASSSSSSSAPSSTATATNKDTGQAPWSSASPFGMDPFTQPLSSSSGGDPFTSTGDPFGVNLFAGVKVEGTTGGNPFAPGPSSWAVPEPLLKPGPNATDAERLAWAKRESGRGQPQSGRGQPRRGEGEHNHNNI